MNQSMVEFVECWMVLPQHVVVSQSASFRVIPPATREQMVGVHAAAVQKEVTVDPPTRLISELCCRNKDGRPVWYTLSTVPLQE